MLSDVLKVIFVIIFSLLFLSLFRVSDKAGIIIILIILLYVLAVIVYYFYYRKSCLFSWDEIPENNEKLKKFLGHKFRISRNKIAVDKIDDGRTIKVSIEKKYHSLKLNDDKTKVNLEIDNSRKYEYIAEMKDSKLNIYSKYFEDSDAYKYWVENLYDSLKLGKFHRSIPLTIIIFELIGLLIVSILNIKMSPDAWFYLFSTIPQVFSSLVALIAVFVIFNVNLNLEIDERKKLNEKIIVLMKESLKFPLILIAISFISIPFGSVKPPNIDNNWITYWVDWKLKWVFIFFVVGFSVSSLYKIYNDLKPLITLIKFKKE